MKKIAVLLALFFWVLPNTHLNAAIIWESDFHQFRYDVNENGGVFAISMQYFNFSEDTAVENYDPRNGQFANYDAIASGNLVEFTAYPGEIQLNAFAKGPDGGVNPPNGLLVQAFAEIVPTDLGATYGVDVGQQVVSLISRRFKVDEDDVYTIDTYLNGLATFDAFDNGNTHHARYSVTGRVSLEELVIVGGQVVDLRPVPGFPLDLAEATRTQSIEVPLVVQDDEQQIVTYQFRVSVALESDVTNYDFQTKQIAAPLTGTYQLGTAASPFELGASILENKPNGLPFIPLLLNGE